MVGWLVQVMVDLRGLLICSLQVAQALWVASLEKIHSIDLEWSHIQGEMELDLGIAPTY